MAFGLTRTRYSPIAVDFGADSIKLLQLAAGEPPQVAAVAAVELPDHVRSDPSLRNAFMLESLKMLLKRSNFQGKRAVLSIPAHQTLVQHLQLPRSEGEDLETLVGAHLRQRLNIDPSRMVLRTYPVAQISRDGTPKQEVICLAVSRDYVMRLLDTASKAKLDVVGMHCEPLAILNAFGHLFRTKEQQQQAYGFIDIGAATTKVVIGHGTQMVLSKVIHAAGDHFTRHRAQVEKIDFNVARKLRINQASWRRAETAEPAAEDDAAAFSGSGSDLLAVIRAEAARDAAPATLVQKAAAPEKVKSLPALHPAEIGEWVECLTDELQMCLRYYQSIFPDRPVERLVFVGGEARQVQLCHLIAKTLGLPSQLGDPLARLVRLTRGVEGVDLAQPQPGWTVPCGLCLSEPAA